MGQPVPESDLPGSEVPAADLPNAKDLSKYENSPISTFAANAVNALTFGLPEYLNKKFTPETYAEGQKYQEANPMAANLGSTVGEAAGYAIPGAYGAVKGAQMGARGAGALMSRYAPNLGTNFQQLGRLYGGAQGATAGGTMGAQVGAAVPGVVSGNPAQAVAAPELVNQATNQVPFFSQLSGVTGHAVPAAAGALATGVNKLATNTTNVNNQYQEHMQQFDEDRRMKQAIRKKAFEKVMGPVVPGTF